MRFGFAGNQAAMQIIDPSSLLFIPLSVLFSCVIGFVVPAGPSHSIGVLGRTDRGAGQRDGVLGPCPVTVGANAAGVCRFLTDAILAPCYRANGSGLGGAYSVITVQGLSGPCLLHDSAGHQGGAGDGVPVTHSCIFDHQRQNPPDAPASAPHVPPPFSQKGASACLL